VVTHNCSWLRNWTGVWRCMGEQQMGPLMVPQGAAPGKTGALVEKEGRFLVPRGPPIAKNQDLLMAKRSCPHGPRNR
jgi:hypothetical protein